MFGWVGSPTTVTSRCNANCGDQHTAIMVSAVEQQRSYCHWHRRTTKPVRDRTLVRAGHLAVSARVLDIVAATNCNAKNAPTVAARTPDSLADDHLRLALTHRGHPIDGWGGCNPAAQAMNSAELSVRPRHVHKTSLEFFLLPAHILWPPHHLNSLVQERADGCTMTAIGAAVCFRCGAP